MKLSSKRLVSMLICLAMVLAMVPMAVTAWSAETVTIYYDNSASNWDTVLAHYWNGSESTIFPGIAMTQVEGTDVWCLDVPVDATEILFTNKVDGNNGSQTVDLTIPTDGSNYTNGTEWLVYGSEDSFAAPDYYVAGEAGLCGSEWSCNDEANKMTEVSTGIYELTYAGVAAGTYEIKVTNGTWDQCWGDSASENGNYFITVDVTSDVVISFDKETESISVALSPVAFNLSDGSVESITLAPGATANLVVDATASDIILNINGGRSYYNWSVSLGVQNYAPNMMGACEITLSAGSVYELTLVSADTEADQILEVSAAAPVVGTESHPAQLVMGENSCSVADWVYYFYTWTATEDGVLTITVDTDACSDWVVAADGALADGSYVYGDPIYSDVLPVVSTLTVNAKAGDQYTIRAGTASYMAGSIVFDASFTPGEGGGEAGGEEPSGIVLEEGTISLMSNPDIMLGIPAQSHTFTWTATQDGKLYVNMFASEPGWAFVFTYADGSTTLRITGNDDRTEVYEVLAGQTYSVQIWCYDKANWGEGNGDVSYSITFEAGEVSQPTKEEFDYSNVSLVVGENNLTMLENAENTLFEFCPTEMGVYTFTVPFGYQIGNWGFGMKPAEEMTFSFTWECTSIGQNIQVGVAGSEPVTLVIEKTGEAVLPEQIVYEDYVNTHTPSTSNRPVLIGTQTFENVDITVPQTAVLGDDGFYHLGSAAGPVLYADLINEAIDLTAAYAGYGANAMKGLIRDEEGNVVVAYNFLNSMKAYKDAMDRNGRYPLTEDLALFLKAYGNSQAWYDSNMTSFTAIKSAHNADSAWLVSCCYIKSNDPVDPPVDPTDPTDPTTEVTEPSTEVTEPSTEVTEPSSEATEPSTEVTEPSTEVTEPSTEVTEPSTEITEPTTEATEPSVEDATVPSTEPSDLSDYRVVGDTEWLGSWDPSNESGRMMEISEGVYQITFKNVPVGTYEFKITKGGTWDENWGDGGANGGNIKLDVDVAGDVVITFKVADSSIGVETAEEEIPKTSDATITALTAALLLAGAAVLFVKKKED